MFNDRIETTYKSISCREVYEELITNYIYYKYINIFKEKIIDNSNKEILVMENIEKSKLQKQL